METFLNHFKPWSICQYLDIDKSWFLTTYLAEFKRGWIELWNIFAI